MSSKNAPRPRLWAPVAIYMGAIFYVSSMSDPAIPTGTDKPLHWLAYMGLAVLVVRGLAGGAGRRIGVRTGAVALLITIGYGITDEVHQLFVPGRSADAYDLVADSAGALAGTVGCWIWGMFDTRHKAQGARDKAQARVP
jgi:VanZ family protein